KRGYKMRELAYLPCAVPILARMQQPCPSGRVWEGPLGGVYTKLISKFTSSTNSSILSSISSFVSSCSLVGPNFSTQKEASAEPIMIDVFMFSKEISFVLA